MTIRFLPEKCSHGVTVPTKYLGKSLDDSAHGWYFPDCRDASKNLRHHSSAELGDPDPAMYSDLEIARGAGQRRARSDKGKKRGPRNDAAIVG